MSEPQEPRRRHSRLGGAALIAAGLAAGAAGARFLAPRAPKPGAPAAAPPAKPVRYQCPMHPQIILDHPGECPICGMTLVAMEGTPGPAGSAVEGQAAITIDPGRQQLIGLTTARVAEGEVAGTFRTVGRVVPDETRVRRINVKVEGFVERLHVDFLGRPVRRGEALFDLFSPEFVSAQREYLLALRTRQALEPGPYGQSGADLVESARRRLRLWDVPQEEIERLERTGEARRALTLRSPIAGVVTAKSVVEGARLTPADVPLEITDLGRVWVMADAYENELARMKPGLAAELTLQAYPGRVWRGRIAFVDPVVDPKTRTTKLRLEFPNPGGELRPELFGEVQVKGPSHRGLLVPLDAVLDAGVRKVAFVALGEGRFEPREVLTGATVGEKVEILKGLEAGDEVVTRANFLVDSESRLRAALDRLAPAPKP